LAELVRDAIPAATRRVGGHPAKRTFQALRIEVNGELDALRAAVPAALEALRLGGRMVAMSYQSLEDRIVKQSIAALATDTTPQGLPVMLSEHRPYLRVLTRGAEVASADEIAANPRAASVRLRAAERIRVSA
jgi:16S rRNA (cytosine1402-N4)-methyltransferase